MAPLAELHASVPLQEEFAIVLYAALHALPPMQAPAPIAPAVGQLRGLLQALDPMQEPTPTTRLA